VVTRTTTTTTDEQQRFNTFMTQYNVINLENVKWLVDRRERKKMERNFKIPRTYQSWEVRDNAVGEIRKWSLHSTFRILQMYSRELKAGGKGDGTNG
jgi:hypothetical protein